jgi:hypothetical protein
MKSSDEWERLHEKLNFDINKLTILSFSSLANSLAGVAARMRGKLTN